MWYGGNYSSKNLDGLIAYNMAKNLVDKYKLYSYRAILNDIKELPYNCSRERFAAMIRHLVIFGDIYGQNYISS